MKATSLAFALVLVSLAASRPTFAHERHEVSFPRFSCRDSQVGWAARHPSTDRDFAITTEDGKVTLLLTRDVVALQLSDRTLHRVDRKLHREESEREDGVLGDVVKATVLACVRRLLDHSAECAIRDIDRVEYRDGRLAFITADGRRVMRGVEVDDRDVMGCFSERDARAFADEFRRAKAHAY